MKACNNVRGDIHVTMDIAGGGVERLGNGGGSKEDDGQDVIVEEESNIITRVVNELEVRWTKMSIADEDETGKS